MNITFMIGNGFDLNLGLRTLYTNFLERYTLPKPTDTKMLEAFKKDILREEKLWSSAEKAFGQYTSDFDGKERTAEDYCDCHEHFCEELAHYLSEEETRIDFSEQGRVADFLADIRNTKKGFRTQPSNEISDYINSIRGGFIYSFLSFNYTHTLDHYVSAISSGNMIGKRNHNHALYENAVRPVIHVHGSTERDMVLGVNDETQISNPALFEDKPDAYRAQIIKQQTNFSNEEGTDEGAAKILAESDLIYIYGMSLGETDALWWERVCNVMEKKRNVLVVIHAFDAPPEGLITRRFHMFRDARKQDLLKYAKSDDATKQALANRIYVTGANLFENLKDIARPADVSAAELIASALSTV